MNPMKALRDRALVHPRPDTALAMREAADRLQVALRALADDPTEDSLRSVNGAWARAHRLLGLRDPNLPGGGGMKRAA